MPIDKSWISIRNRLSDEYWNGLTGFIEHAKNYTNSQGLISCPCIKCRNGYLHPPEKVFAHIHDKGFDKTYTKWVFHGESYSTVPTISESVDEMAAVLNDVAGASEAHDDIPGDTHEDADDPNDNDVHRNEITQSNSIESLDDIQSREFPQWFQKKMFSLREINSPDVTEQLFSLANGSKHIEDVVVVDEITGGNFELFVELPDIETMTWSQSNVRPDVVTSDIEAILNDQYNVEDDFINDEEDATLDEYLEDDNESTDNDDDVNDVHVMSRPVATGASSSGGAQPPHDPRRLPAHSADSAPPHHKGREKAKGINVGTYVNRFGKIRLPIDEEGEVYNAIGDEGSWYKSTLGMHTRDICEPFHNSWKSVPAHQRKLVHERLRDWFEIDYTYKNGVLYHMVERDAATRYRNWKANLNLHFKNKGGLHNLDRAKAQPPKYLRNKSDHWEKCCDRFSTETFQANPETRKLQPPIQNFRDMHTRAGAWVNSQAEETYERAKQMAVSGSDASSGPMDEIAVMKEVLGQRRGYIRGVGPTLPRAAFPRPPNASVGVSLQEHQQVVGRLDELTNAYKTLHDIIARLHPNVPLPSFGHDGAPPSSSSSVPASASASTPATTSSPPTHDDDAH
ncbi:hypothetical protein DH2020_005901 [Rehmannia glutinosa]|uniref:Transposase-associated domain-containing protein n=1 Tax=Rehmannia glutinosa TaxID=99300 RepID=A0ABR0XHE2_REHGL